MKKFEAPIMSISVFDTENVVTTASGVTPDAENALTTATAFLTEEKRIAAERIFEFTF